MQLAELIKDWPCTVKGSIRIDVKRVEDDARDVQPGDLFVARKGKTSNGFEYINQALARGACGVVVEEELQLDQLAIDVPIIWVPNALKFISFASAKLLNFPSEALQVIAVTGTNGKTTVTHFIGQILQKLHRKTMVIGTNGVYIQGQQVQRDVETLTTLQPKQLHPLFQEAINQNVEYVILEASSMGLATHRLDYCHITTGVYLNLSEDHIEDHQSFENYKLAKQQLAKLSDQLVLNGDDAFCRSIGVLSKKKKHYFGYGNRVDVQLQLITEEDNFSTCCIQTDQLEKVVTLPVSGDYQRMNILAAITTICTLGFPFKDVCNAAQDVTLPEGRMQLIKNDIGLTLLIDYAHTAEALRSVLQVARKQTKNKLIVVFSCGGERDQQKRAKMGMIASKFADYIFLTTDNPRGESPTKINKQIQEGFLGNQEFDVVLDRKKAIKKAIEYATEGDTVMIIGKGHERTQTIGGRTLPFSDYDCIQEVLRASLNNNK